MGVRGAFAQIWVAGTLSKIWDTSALCSPLDQQLLILATSIIRGQKDILGVIRGWSMPPPEQSRDKMSQILDQVPPKSWQDSLTYIGIRVSHKFRKLHPQMAHWGKCYWPWVRVSQKTQKFLDFICKLINCAPMCGKSLCKKKSNPRILVGIWPECLGGPRAQLVNLQK